MVLYANNSRKVIIVCKKHGEFKQSPSHHLDGENCPKCSTTISSGHQEIIDFTKTLGCEMKINDREQINPLELDIYIPNRCFAKYEKLGFRMSRVIKPNYAYTKRGRVFKKVFDIGSDDMFADGYKKLWDAGHYKYEWKILGDKDGG